MVEKKQGGLNLAIEYGKRIVDMLGGERDHQENVIIAGYELDFRNKKVRSEQTEVSLTSGQMKQLQYLLERLNQDVDAYTMVEELELKTNIQISERGQLEVKRNNLFQNLRQLQKLLTPFQGSLQLVLESKQNLIRLEVA